MSLERLHIVDLNNKPCKDPALAGYDIVELAMSTAEYRTLHITARLLDDNITVKEALTLAYIQGRYDVDLELNNLDADTE